jgi:MFS family permease
MNKIKAIVLFTAFIDIIGLGVIIPIMPYYLKSFGAQDFVVTLLISVYALLAFFSAPILGALSDRYGRRPVLVASIISTSIGWFLFKAVYVKTIMMQEEFQHNHLTQTLQDTTHSLV